MQYPVWFKVSAIIMLACQLTACSQGHTEVPPDILKATHSAYLRCSAQVKANKLDDASESCQSGLKAIGAYEPIVKEGLYYQLANVELKRKNYANAEKFAQQNIALTEKLEGTSSVFYALALSQKALAYHSQAKFQLSEPLLVKAANILEKAVIQKHEKNAFGDYLNTMVNLVLAQIGLEKDVAIDNLEKLLKLKGKLNPVEFDLKMSEASALAQVGDLEYSNGYVSKAQKHYEASIALYEQYKLKSPDAKSHVGSMILVPYPSIISAMKHLGEIHEQAGDLEKAKALQDKAKQWGAASNLQDFGLQK